MLHSKIRIFRIFRCSKNIRSLNFCNYMPKDLAERNKTPTFAPSELGELPALRCKKLLCFAPGVEPIVPHFCVYILYVYARATGVKVSLMEVKTLSGKIIALKGKNNNNKDDLLICYEENYFFENIPPSMRPHSWV